jgi:hypothetical protein
VPWAASVRSISALSATSPPWTAPPRRPPPPERATEAAAEPAAAEERLEDVGHGAERVEVRGIAAAAQALVAVAVVGGAAFGIREDLVGLRRLLELVLGLRIVAVDVGVELTGEPSERLLDRGVVGVAGDPQHLVVVADRAHRSS